MRSCSLTASRGPVTDPQRHQLGRIKASATHLLGLIDEILTYSRVEAGSERPHFESVCVQTALEEAASIVEPLANDRGLSLELAVEAGAQGAHVQTDAQKVRQILVNLLSNATKFTPRGTIAPRRAPGGTAAASSTCATRGSASPKSTSTGSSKHSGR